MKKYIVSMVAVLSLLFGWQSSMAGISFDESETKDLEFAFVSGDSPQMALLSEQEMMETEGAIWSVVVNWGIRIWNAIRPATIGATAGAANYTSNWGASQFSDNPQNWSQPQFLSSTVGGALGGPIGNRWGAAGNIGGGIVGSSISGYFGNNNYGNNSISFGRDIGSYCGMCLNYPR